MGPWVFAGATATPADRISLIDIGLSRRRVTPTYRKFLDSPLRSTVSIVAPPVAGRGLPLPRLFAGQSEALDGAPGTLATQSGPWATMGGSSRQGESRCSCALPC